MEGDHVVDIHVSVVVRTKRDHFSKYDPKRSNHANFQLLKIKNKKVMTKLHLFEVKCREGYLIRARNMNKCDNETVLRPI